MEPVQASFCSPFFGFGDSGTGQAMLFLEMSDYLTLSGTASGFAGSEGYFCIAIFFPPAASG